ncbi:uncharacterized protein [Antedon mediterranea]|uniref:uncharacterized protein n=1 Tax=Antedon mediterranea TaxID=105859 RepID=UPI003AF959F1
MTSFQTDKSTFISTLYLSDLDSTFETTTDNSTVTRMLSEATKNAVKLNNNLKKLLGDHRKLEETYCRRSISSKQNVTVDDFIEFNPKLMSTKRSGRNFREIRTDDDDLYLRPVLRHKEEELTTNVTIQHEDKDYMFDCDYTLTDLKKRLAKFEDDLEDFKGVKESFNKRVNQLQRNAIIRGRTWRALLNQRNKNADDQRPAIQEHQALTFRRQFKLFKYIYPVLNNCLLVGEIAFQLERQILACIFQSERFSYGHNLRNIESMLRILPRYTTNDAIRTRYVDTMRLLRGYGWRTTHHPTFVNDVIHYYGTFPDLETARSYALKQGYFYFGTFLTFKVMSILIWLMKILPVKLNPKNEINVVVSLTLKRIHSFKILFPPIPYTF